ncbi:MAG: response regulator, partial [Deltaproteobacteria bacterium]|nr:response regulator [Deltaproteobacteria bacterium]
TILLVDDEPIILDIGDEILGQYGYKVLKAGGGEEAVQLYKNHKNRIDLVILDYNMPGIDGGRCLQELLKINPAVKVLMASGYALNDQIRATLSAGAAGFIGKPYQLKEILQQVRSVLDQNRFGAYAN